MLQTSFALNLRRQRSLLAMISLSARNFAAFRRPCRGSTLRHDTHGEGILQAFIPKTGGIKKRLYAFHDVDNGINRKRCREGGDAEIYTVDCEYLQGRQAGHAKDILAPLCVAPEPHRQCAFCWDASVYRSLRVGCVDSWHAEGQSKINFGRTAIHICSVRVENWNTTWIY